MTCAPEPFRQIEREPAPAAADVQHPHARLDQQLGGDVPLLVQLCRLQVEVRLGEVGAGVLPVAIEEQVVQLAGQIVMVRDVAPRARHRIELARAAQQTMEAAERALERALPDDREVAADEVEKVVERGVLDRQRAVHVRLAGAQFGVEREAPVQRRDRAGEW